MRKCSIKGQSMIEYILLIGAAIAVFIVFLHPGGPFHGVLDDLVNGTANMLNTIVFDVNYIN